MTDHDDLVAKLTEAARVVGEDGQHSFAYGAIKAALESPVAFSPHERLARIRAVIEAVEAVRAERDTP